MDINFFAVFVNLFVLCACTGFILDTASFSIKKLPCTTFMVVIVGIALSIIGAMVTFTQSIQWANIFYLFGVYLSNSEVRAFFKREKPKAIKCNSGIPTRFKRKLK